ncbi:unnamed protein product [[Candida] boidinii]|nr:unnamed protein product [[Candida] boidinii]
MSGFQQQRISAFSTDYSSATSVLYSDNVCASLGVYDIEDSDSGSYYNVGESISVGKTMNGSTESFKVLPSFIYLSGHYAEDNFSFPMVLDSHLTYLTGENFVFIDVNNSIVSTGGLGVGISTIGSNFIDLFIDKGIVDSNSYSLILHGKDVTDLLPLTQMKFQLLQFLVLVFHPLLQIEQ